MIAVCVAAVFGVRGQFFNPLPDPLLPVTLGRAASSCNLPTLKQGAPARLTLGGVDMRWDGLVAVY